MKAFQIGLGMALALAACTVESDEDQLENTIRAELSNQGAVQQVELRKEEDGNMTGFVVIREPNGRVGRLACSAQAAGAGKYAWKCSPAIDAKTLKEMEEVIRAELSKRGPVKQIEMKRAGDDNHMSGFAVVQNEEGEEFRLACSATRNSDTPGTFAWTCSDENTEG